MVSSFSALVDWVGESGAVLGLEVVCEPTGRLGKSIPRIRTSPANDDLREKQDTNLCAASTIPASHTTPMKIHKAVITAAGSDQRHLPLQTIVSASGETKTAIQLLLDEIFAAGIRNAAIIVAPGQTEAFRAAVGGHLPQIEFIEQPEPLALVAARV